MTILVTGFNKFGELPFNPTEGVVELLAAETDAPHADEIVAEVLPTEYAAAANAIEDLIHSTQPTIILGLGVSTRRDKICLERFALNVDDAVLEDNCGCVRTGEEIELGAPAALKTNTDVSSVLRRLADQQIRAQISNHAGTFVCNHVYYRALWMLAKQQSQTRCLFVHVPMPSAGTAPDHASAHTWWNMSDLHQAVHLILAELVRQRRGIA